MNCDLRDLRALGCDRVYADHTGSNREERAEAINALRSGDQLVVMRRAHLGIGREIPRLQEMIESRGATLLVHEIETPRLPARKPGPAPEFQPDYAQERRSRHYWHGPYKRSEALKEIRATMGYGVSVATLNRHLGPRSKPTKWLNSKERE